ncbi:MAG: helix-turn-helix transcriptional regulator [Oscillospiraceae bacterium]|nr:helix-turn-helix transcriptional regulator [Oscillospiraceae bacterium]
MFNNIENLKIENIYRGTSKSRSSVLSKKTTSILLRTEGCMRYFFPDETLDVPEGNIIFVPRGAAFETVAVREPCKFVSITVSADFPEGTLPFTQSIEDFHEISELSNILPELWKFGNKSEHYKCYSFFYSLLSWLENQSHIDKKKEDIISPSVSYLKKHIYDCDLKVDILPELCGISGTYFRNLFKMRFGESPREYILSKRLSHAKAIIESGDFETIADVAASVGYTDPLYFSRAFKKKYGVSPSFYNEL